MPEKEQSTKTDEEFRKEALELYREGKASGRYDEIVSAIRKAIDEAKKGGTGNAKHL